MHADKIKRGKETFIAPNATVIGNVEMGDQSSIWYGAVIRGDNDFIKIGAKTNIQDLALVHVDPDVPVDIGQEVVVGHHAIIHGATVGDNSLIGMRATLLNHVKIGKCCIIGAHSLVTSGTEIPDYSLVMGSPAHVVRELLDDEVKSIRDNALRYVEKALEYKNAYEE